MTSGSVPFARKAARPLLDESHSADRVIVGLSMLAVLPLMDALPSPAVLAMAIAGLALSGAALGLPMQAYTLLGITTAPPKHFGSAMASLTLARQLGGSVGAAAFGWLLIIMSDSANATVAILGLAGLLLTGRLVAAPRRRDEPETERT